MEYPAFYEEHIRSVIDAYNAARARTENGVGFVFITDVKAVLCGGDHCWAFGSKAQCVADFADSLGYMDPIREEMQLYHAHGNHDVTVRSSWDLETGYTMPREQMQALFSVHTTPPTGSVEGKLYYYTDDQERKIRYVIVDTCEPHGGEDAPWGVGYGLSEEQLHWLADCALRLPGADWSAVVMGHVPCAPELPSYRGELADMRLILEAFKHKQSCAYGDFQGAQGELVAYLCGHNHKDRDTVCNGLLHTSTGCDTYCKDDNLTREVGKTENTLFDLVLVDKDAKTIRFFRVGAGNSREFSY